MLEGEAQGSRRPALLNLQRLGVDLQHQALVLEIIVDIAGAVGHGKLGTAAQIDRSGHFSVRRLDGGGTIAATIEREDS